MMCCRTICNLFQSTLPTRGSDPLQQRIRRCSVISIHAPHEGERLSGTRRSCLALTFQSTLPTRGSDKTFCRPSPARSGFQSTLPTRGSDVIPSPQFRPRSRFQSTLPTRGSDMDAARRGSKEQAISIHAPHEGERPICKYRATA